MTRRLAAAFVFVAVAATPAALAQAKFPKFTNHVVDQANVIPDDVEDEVNRGLDDYQKRSTNQIAVAAVETTGNQSIEDYSEDLFDAWGIGDKDKENGVLLVIAYDDRQMRVEVGYGLEGDLTDLESGEIINDYMTPLMREGNVGEAVTVGTNEIRRALGDTELGAPPPVIDDPGGDGSGISGFAWLIALLIFGPLSGILGGRGRRRRGWVSPIFWGAGLGGLAGRSRGGFGGGGFGGGGGGFGGGGGGFGGGGGGGSGGGGASGGW